MSSASKKSTKGSAPSRPKSKSTQRSALDDLIATDSEPDLGDSKLPPSFDPQTMGSDHPFPYNNELTRRKKTTKSGHLDPSTNSHHSRGSSEDDDEGGDELDGGTGSNFIALSESSDDDQDGLFDDDDEDTGGDDILFCHFFDLYAYQQLLSTPPDQSNNHPPTPTLSMDTTIPIVYPSTLFHMDPDSAYPVHDFHLVQAEAYQKQQQRLLRAEKYLQRTQKDHIGDWKRRFRQQQVELQDSRAELAKIDALLAPTTSSSIQSSGAGNMFSSVPPSTNPSALAAAGAAAATGAQTLFSNSTTTDPQPVDDSWISKDIFTYSPFTPSNFTALPHDGPVILPQQEQQMTFFGKLFHYNTIAQMLGYSAASNLLTHGGKSIHLPSMRAPIMKHSGTLSGALGRASAHATMGAFSDDEDNGSGIASSHPALSTATAKSRGKKTAGLTDHEDASTATDPTTAAHTSTTTTAVSAAPAAAKESEYFTPNPDGSWTDPIDQTIINEAFIDQCFITFEQKLKASVGPVCLQEVQAQATLPDLSHVQAEKLKQFLPATYAQVLQAHRDKCTAQNEAASKLAASASSDPNDKTDQPAAPPKLLDPDTLPLLPNPVSKVILSKGISFKPLAELWNHPEIRYIAFYWAHFHNVSAKSREATQTFLKLFELMWFLSWSSLRSKLRTIYSTNYASLAAKAHTTTTTTTTMADSDAPAATPASTMTTHDPAPDASHPTTTTTTSTTTSTAEPAAVTKPQLKRGPKMKSTPSILSSAGAQVDHISQQLAGTGSTPAEQLTKGGAGKKRKQLPQIKEAGEQQPAPSDAQNPNSQDSDATHVPIVKRGRGRPAAATATATPTKAPPTHTTSQPTDTAHGDAPRDSSDWVQLAAGDTMADSSPLSPARSRRSLVPASPAKPDSLNDSLLSLFSEDDHDDDEQVECRSVAHHQSESGEDSDDDVTGALSDAPVDAVERPPAAPTSTPNPPRRKPGPKPKQIRPLNSPALSPVLIQEDSDVDKLDEDPVKPPPVSTPNPPRRKPGPKPKQTTHPITSPSLSPSLLDDNDIDELDEEESAKNPPARGRRQAARGKPAPVADKMDDSDASLADADNQSVAPPPRTGRASRLQPAVESVIDLSHQQETSSAAPQRRSTRRTLL
jgi:hypothetical protein